MATFGVRAVELSAEFDTRSPGGRHELFCGLSANANRINTRRAYQLLRAVADGINSASTGDIPLSYFEAIYDDPSEAQAMHNIHADRAAFARRNARHAPPISDDGG